MSKIHKSISVWRKFEWQTKKFYNAAKVFLFRKILYVKEVQKPLLKIRIRESKAVENEEVEWIAIR